MGSLDKLAILFLTLPFLEVPALPRALKDKRKKILCFSSRKEEMFSFQGKPKKPPQSDSARRAEEKRGNWLCEDKRRAGEVYVQGDRECRSSQLQDRHGKVVRLLVRALAGAESLTSLLYFEQDNKEDRDETTSLVTRV